MSDQKLAEIEARRFDRFYWDDKDLPASDLTWLLDRVRKLEKVREEALRLSKDVAYLNDALAELHSAKEGE